MSEERFTYRGVVYPWQCDAMGHMNVQHYVAAFDQAIWHLLHAAGFEPSRIHDRREGFADVRYVIEYKEEVRAGDLIVATSEVRRIGRSSVVSFHRISNAERGQVAAELEATTVLFDLDARRSIPIPDDLRAGLEKLLVPA